MNFNSFDLYGRLPATIETSRRVARIGALLDRYADQSYGGDVCFRHTS
jgi:hypothetical protein